MARRLRLLFGLFPQSGIVANSVAEQSGRVSCACLLSSPNFQLQHFRLLFPYDLPRSHRERIQLRRRIDALGSVEQSFDG